MPLPRHASFIQTRWSMVRRAVDDQASGSQLALGQLCQNCWYPIYAFIRRSGKSAEDAEDLCQGFFERVIRTRLLASADPEKGRLRTFLLSCLKHYMADQHDRNLAQKRGAGKVVEFSALSAEEQYLAEPVDTVTPDRLYQRQWALQIISTSMQELESTYQSEGKAALFTALKPFLGFSQSSEPNYQTVADALGLNLNTLKSHIRRLRERWRDTIRAQVAATLDDPTPDEIKAELRELLGSC